MKYQDFGEEYDKNTLKFTWKLKSGKWKPQKLQKEVRITYNLCLYFKNSEGLLWSTQNLKARISRCHVHSRNFSITKVIQSGESICHNLLKVLGLIFFRYEEILQINKKTKCLQKNG